MLEVTQQDDDNSLGLFPLAPLPLSGWISEQAWWAQNNHQGSPGTSSFCPETWGFV